MVCDILVDAGGSELKTAAYLIDSGEISPVQHFLAHSQEKKEVILEGLCEAIVSTAEASGASIQEVQKIKMAFPGPFQYEQGISYMAGLNKYESIYGISLPAELGTRLAKKRSAFCFIHDVAAFAMGVVDYHHLTDTTRAMHLCIGTGAGTAFTIGRHLVTDSREGVPPEGWIYAGIFRESIVDDYISARGIRRLAIRFMGKELTPKELSLLAREGDGNAQQAYLTFGEDLSEAICPFLADFQAEVLVLGGQISRSANLFLAPLREQLKPMGIKIIVEKDASRMSMLGLSKI